MPSDDVAPWALVAQVLEIVRTRSLKREEVDWETVGPAFEAKARTCRTLEHAHDVSRELLALLADGHSFLQTPSDLQRRNVPVHTGLRLHQGEPVVIDVGEGSPADRHGIRVGDRVVRVNDERVTADDWRRLRRAALEAPTTLEVAGPNGSRFVTLSGGYVQPPLPPRAQMRTSDIGLIDLPGHVGDGILGDGRTYDELLSAYLHELETDGARRWIIDLRRCDGGNMWPLLAGLTPLLGTGTYGAFVDPVADMWLEWGFDGSKLHVTNRDDSAETYVMMDVADWQPLKNPGARVALLTSAVTSSSGEAVLISFLGRDDTRTFGLPTGGLTTSNDLHVLIDGSRLLLAEHLEADRNDEVYAGRIGPNDVVEIEWSLLRDEADPTVRAAIEWLESDG